MQNMLIVVNNNNKKTSLNEIPTYTTIKKCIKRNKCSVYLYIFIIILHTCVECRSCRYRRRKTVLDKTRDRYLKNPRRGVCSVAIIIADDDVHNNKR